MSYLDGAITVGACEHGERIAEYTRKKLPEMTVTVSPLESVWVCVQCARDRDMRLACGGGTEPDYCDAIMFGGLHFWGVDREPFCAWAKAFADEIAMALMEAAR